MATEILDEDADGDPPLTEPVMVACLFVNGAATEVGKHYGRTVAWTSLPDLGGEMGERRISIRFAMPIDAMRSYWRDLGEQLKRVR